MKREEVINFLKSMDVKGLDPFEFLCSNGQLENVNKLYILRKMISQLHADEHVHKMYAVLLADNPKDILEQVVQGKDPDFLKKMIKKANSHEHSINLYEVGEYEKEQSAFWYPILNTIDPRYDQFNESANKLKKVSRFDKIKSKFRKKEKFDTILYGTKFEKMIAYYVSLPEEKKKKEEELSSLKWYEIKKKNKLKNELTEIDVKREKYYDSILYFSPASVENMEKAVIKDGDKEVEVDPQEWWENFYKSHEEEMLKYVEMQIEKEKQKYAGTKNGKENREMSLEAKESLYRKYIDKYCFGVERFDGAVYGLKTDVKNTLEFMQKIYCKDHKDQGLEEILSDIRSSFGRNLRLFDKEKYRDSTLLSGDNEFMKNASKGMNVQKDMEALKEEFKELKDIKDNDEYVDKAIEIYAKFIQIHPYPDGNGRTSRALLDVMLLNRDIVPPILYDTYYDREELDTRVGKYTLEGKKDPLRLFIKEKIIEQNGSIFSKEVDKDKKKVKEIEGKEDI